MPDTRLEVPQPAPPRLLDRVREAIRSRHYSPRTEKAYVFWIRRFIVFSGRRHPDTMGEPEITKFLGALATRLRVSASTQNQAFSAILFLYRTVLGRELKGLQGTPRAKLPERVPVVLSQNELSAIFSNLRGVPAVAAALLYASGLRLSEAMQLRVKDIDFDRKEIVIRRGKGQKDRRTMLPPGLEMPLLAHLSTSLAVSRASTPRHRSSGAGGGCSPPPAPGSIPLRASGFATTCTNRCCNARSTRQSRTRALPRRRAATRCDIRSPPTCWNAATTCELSRNCSAMPTFRQR